MDCDIRVATDDSRGAAWGVDEDAIMEAIVIEQVEEGEDGADPQEFSLEQEEE